MRYHPKRADQVSIGDRVYHRHTRGYHAVTRVDVLPEAEYYGDRLQLWMRDAKGEFCLEADPGQMVAVQVKDQRPAR